MREAEAELQPADSLPQGGQTLVQELGLLEPGPAEYILKGWLMWRYMTSKWSVGRSQKVFHKIKELNCGIGFFIGIIEPPDFHHPICRRSLLLDVPQPGWTGALPYAISAKASTLPFFMKRLMPACIVDAQSQMMEKEKPFISKDPPALMF